MHTMDFNSFIPDILATVLGGIFLTFLFFLLREKVFALPDVNGRWYLETKTLESEYNPYQNMILKHILMVYREGNYIYGTSEKIYENSSTGEHEYIGDARKRGVVEGAIEKKYFGKDKIMLHIVINDFGRESTYFVNLEKISSIEFTGNYKSMVANQSGTATLKLS